MRSKEKRKLKQAIAGILSAALVIPVLSGFFTDKAQASVMETFTVDMADTKHEIVHGAAGFLYGVSSEDVPTTNTMVPLKPKILATKGALGTEHPYGDALDVARTFLESGGEQVQMYNSNYYGVFGVMADYKEYSKVLETIIAPAVVEWKKAWNEEHGTPEEPKDNIGRRINIDEALVYIPINEGTPVVGAPGGTNNERFSVAFESYYKAIQAGDPGASVAGPNCWSYQGAVDYRYFVKYCYANDCLPDVFTWHELDQSDLRDMGEHVSTFKQIWKEEITDNGGPKEPQIVANEYARSVDCGVPGALVNWIARLEDEGIYGCLPFWHQANNLNDLTADANEGNGAWWVYKWYGDMSGQTLGVNSTTSYEKLYGLATLDEAKQSSSILLGGVGGSTNVVVKNVNSTETFKNADKVHVKVESTAFTGFHGAQTEVPIIIEGTFPVHSDGSVLMELNGMKAETAYNITLTKAAEEDSIDTPMTSTYQAVYEAEDMNYAESAYRTSNGGYHYSANAAVAMPVNAELTYKIQVPADGKYKLDYIYANGTGENRNDADNHSPKNIEQIYKLDDKEPYSVSMRSTLLSDMSGLYSEYVDLTAGEHTIKIITSDAIETGVVTHDVLTVTYNGAYGEPVKTFNTVYEAEQADFNRLSDNTVSSVMTRTQLQGYSGNGYVTGISNPRVTQGGGIRWNVIVGESGLYDLSLCYQAEVDAEAGIYVGNTATTLDNLTKTLLLQATKGQWTAANSTIYLQKGINIIDVDAVGDVSLDYMRVRGIDDSLKTEEAKSLTIEAEDALPNGATQIGITQSKSASNNQYVNGLEGDTEALTDVNKYLEFTINAANTGIYDMQIFQSNDRICGSHAYNTKIIDTYASVQVSHDNEVLSDSRYFFINTFSVDTFKEKTVPITLKQGENTVRIYNDDSWKVLWGGTQSTPGENELDNYSPNFDKFIITPRTLDEAIVLPDEYAIDIRTTSGGYAFADRNVTQKNGSFMVTMYPEKEIIKAVLNNKDVTNQIVENKLEITDVTEDQILRVYFDPSITEHTDTYIKNAGFGTGDASDWILSEGQVEKIPSNVYEGNYMKLSGTLEQEIQGVAQGQYVLKVMSKANSGSSETGAVVLSVGEREIELSMGRDYAENLLPIYVDNEEPISIKVDASGLNGTFICLDNFVLQESTHEERDDVNRGIEYFVDAGDHYPSTLSRGEYFGSKNSVTDQEFKADSETGYRWGVVTTENDPLIVNTMNTQGIYTKYQWALEHSTKDSTNKTDSFRYARGQAEAGISPRYVSYMFELEPGDYTIEAGFSNTWGNANTPSLYVDDELMGRANVNNENNVVTGEFTVSQESRFVSVNVQSTNDTIQLTYIYIIPNKEHADLGKLVHAYENARTITNDESDPFMEGTWQAFENLREAAGVVLLEESVDFSRQMEVDNLAKNLTSAQKALVKISAAIDEDILYFVDAGDVSPTVLSDGDKFGIYNHVTDQIFKTDEVTGKQWGAIDYIGYEWEGSLSTNTTGVIGEYDSPKNVSFRFARDQDANEAVKNNVGELYVDYRFELEAGKEYNVLVAVGNCWSNSSPVSVYANRGIGSEIAEKPGTVLKENVIIGGGTGVTSLVNAVAMADEEGFLTINVRSEYIRPKTVNVNYIVIKELGEPEEPDGDKTELQVLYDSVKEKTQGNYTDASWKSFTDALEEALEILEQDKVTKEQVDTAFENLVDAIGRLMDKTKPSAITIALLQGQIRLAEQIEAIGSEEYEAESWNAFADALYTARAFNNNISAYDDAQVLEAAEKLRDAIAALDKKTDKSLLEAFVEAAQDMLLPENAEQYIEISIETLQDVLGRALEVLAHDNASQDEVDAITSELIEAIYQMYKKGDTTGLQTLVNFLSGYFEHDYTPDSWAGFADAFEEACDILESGIITEFDQERINVSASQLLDAMNKLVRRADFSALNAVVLKAQSVIAESGKYVSSTISGLPPALDEANAILSNANASQAEVNEATKKLTEELMKARLKPDFSLLLNALNIVKGMDLSIYTSDSTSPLFALMATGQAFLDHPEEALQEEVDSLTEQIYTTIKGLAIKPIEEKPDEGNYEVPKAPSTPEAVTPGRVGTSIIPQTVSQTQREDIVANGTTRQETKAIELDTAEIGTIAEGKDIAEAEILAEGETLAEENVPLAGQLSSTVNNGSSQLVVMLLALLGVLVLVMVAKKRKERE